MALGLGFANKSQTENVAGKSGKGERKGQSDVSTGGQLGCADQHPLPAAKQEPQVSEEEDAGPLPREMWSCHLFRSTGPATF